MYYPSCPVSLHTTSLPVICQTIAISARWAPPHKASQRYPQMSTLSPCLQSPALQSALRGKKIMQGYTPADLGRFLSLQWREPLQFLPQVRPSGQFTPLTSRPGLSRQPHKSQPPSRSQSAMVTFFPLMLCCTFQYLTIIDICGVYVICWVQRLWLRFGWVDHSPLTSNYCLSINISGSKKSIICEF